MWAQFATIPFGLWLMAMPDIMGYGGVARTNDHIVGPLIVSFAVIAMAETTRSLRWLNSALGLWLVVVPMMLEYPIHIGLQSLVVGMVVLALSFVEDPQKEQIGGGWKSLWKEHRVAETNADSALSRAPGDKAG